MSESNFQVTRGPGEPRSERMRLLVVRRTMLWFRDYDKCVQILLKPGQLARSATRVNSTLFESLPLPLPPTLRV